jgi:hypothetical protein
VMVQGAYSFNGSGGQSHNPSTLPSL